MTEQTPARTLWESLGFCECGRPEDVLSLVRDALRLMENKFAASMRTKDGAWSAQVELERALLPLEDPKSLLVRYVLDAKGLTEHGSSVYGCWPTRKGQELLAYLEDTPEEEWLAASKYDLPDGEGLGEQP